MALTKEWDKDFVLTDVFFSVGEELTFSEC